MERYIAGGAFLVGGLASFYYALRALRTGRAYLQPNWYTRGKHPMPYWVSTLGLLLCGIFFSTFGGIVLFDLTSHVGEWIN